MNARSHAEWVALGYPRGRPANAAECFDPVRLPLTAYEQSCADAYAAKCASYLGDDEPAGQERPGFYDEIQRRGD